MEFKVPTIMCRSNIKQFLLITKIHILVGENDRKRAILNNLGNVTCCSLLPECRSEALRTIFIHHCSVQAMYMRHLINGLYGSINELQEQCVRYITEFGHSY